MTSENWLTVEKEDSSTLSFTENLQFQDWAIFTDFDDITARYKKPAGPRSIVLQALDAGFDVWLANGRGTRYSLEHVTLDARVNPEYWDFGWDTMGKYDNPANINKVLEVTGYSKLAIVGYSTGTM